MSLNYKMKEHASWLQRRRKYKHSLFVPIPQIVLSLLLMVTMTPISSSFLQSQLLSSSTLHRVEPYNMADSGDDSDSNNNNNGGFDPIVSTLARIEDAQSSSAFRIAGSAGSTKYDPTIEWKEVRLPSRDDEDDYELDTVQVNADGTLSGVAVATPPSNDDIAYVLRQEQTSSSAPPSCVVLFVGGAGLGQFPQVSYDQMLRRVHHQLGGSAAIVSVPYTASLDHLSLSRTVSDALRRGLLSLDGIDGDDTFDGLPPVYLLGHSLGCKLLSLSLCAGGLRDIVTGVGLVSYSNAAFADSLRIAGEFARGFNENKGMGVGSAAFGGIMDRFGGFDGILDLATGAAGAVGLEFVPSPSDTNRAVSLKYNGSNEKDDDKERGNLASKTRLFVFDDDGIDDGEGFVAAIRDNNEGLNGSVDASGLPGSHLTPVYLQLGVNDVLRGVGGDINEMLSPDQIKDYVESALGGFKEASFGNEEELDMLVSEVVRWMLGKAPTRSPGGWNRNGSDYGSGGGWIGPSSTSSSQE